VLVVNSFVESLTFEAERQLLYYKFQGLLTVQALRMLPNSHVNWLAVHWGRNDVIQVFLFYFTVKCKNIHTVPVCVFTVKMK
jgi:uncharacterized ParB-like nuclease family protein